MNRSLERVMSFDLQHSFDRCGFASLSELETPEWQKEFRELEILQDRFLRSHPHPPKYRWPRDPLHYCTRVWEYPYVYHHLKVWLQNATGEKPPLVVDLASGVTFFPFSIADLSCSVICIDTDPVAAQAYSQIGGRFKVDRGSVEFTQANALSIPLDTGSVDCLYCISALEHIVDSPRVIEEVARVLHPGGRFCLTFDVDFKDNFELGPHRFEELMATIATFFLFAYPQTTIHPRRILTSDKGPFPLYKSTRKSALLRFLSQAKWTLLASSRIHITVYGGFFVRNGEPARSARSRREPLLNAAII